MLNVSTICISKYNCLNFFVLVLNVFLIPIEMTDLHLHVEEAASYLAVKGQLADDPFPQHLNGMAG